MQSEKKSRRLNREQELSSGKKMFRRGGLPRNRIKREADHSGGERLDLVRAREKRKG